MRALLCADIHLFGGPDEKNLFPHQMRRWGQKRERIEYAKAEKDSINALGRVAEYIRYSKPDVVIILGDIVGGHMGEGMFTHRMKEQARLVRKTLECNNVPVKYIPGNHDLGYKPEINERSIAAWQEVFGDIYWGFEADDVYHIGICSPLAEYKGNNVRIANLRCTQNGMVTEAMRRVNMGQDIVIHSHSMSITQTMKDTLCGPCPGNIRRIYTADLHDPMKFKMIRYSKRLVSFGKTKQLLNLCQIVPSLAPLWWTGFSCLEVNIGTIDNTEKPIRLEGNASNSFTSMWQCLRGMSKI